MPGITETAFATQVEDLLTRLGWRWVHFRPAMRRNGRWYTALSGSAGFFDYVAARKSDRRLLFIELKDETSELDPEQEVWFEVLEECQKSIIVQPLKIASGTASVKLGKASYMTVPEIYLWRPSDGEPEGGEILRILR